MKVSEAARRLKKSEQFVGIGLQNLIERLNADNGCKGCPVFNECSSYASCEDAQKVGLNGIVRTSKRRIKTDGRA